MEQVLKKKDLIDITVRNVRKVHAVKLCTVDDLKSRYLHVLWDEGLHRKNVKAFLEEITFSFQERHFTVSLMR